MNVVDVGLQISCFNAGVYSTLAELVAVSHDVAVDVVFEDGFNKPHVLVIGDSSSIIDFCSQKVDDFVWHVVVLIKQHFELSLADGQILVGEFVGNVPSNWTEFSAILNDGMEKCKSEEQFLVFIWFFTLLQFVIS